MREVLDGRAEEGIFVQELIDTDEVWIRSIIDANREEVGIFLNFPKEREA